MLAVNSNQYMFKWEHYKDIKESFVCSTLWQYMLNSGLKIRLKVVLQILFFLLYLRKKVSGKTNNLQSARYAKMHFTRSVCLINAKEILKSILFLFVMSKRCKIIPNVPRIKTPKFWRSLRNIWDRKNQKSSIKTWMVYCQNWTIS